MEKKYVITGFAFAAMLLMSIGVVYAYQGDLSVKGPNYSEERHELMEQAFDNLDYDAWVSLMTEEGRNPRVLEIVTKENFALFAEAHEAMENGDMNRAKEIRTELGLGLKNGQGMRGQGSHEGRGQGNGYGMRGQGNHGECPYA